MIRRLVAKVKSKGTGVSGSQRLSASALSFLRPCTWETSKETLEMDAISAIFSRMKAIGLLVLNSKLARLSAPVLSETDGKMIGRRLCCNCLAAINKRQHCAKVSRAVICFWRSPCTSQHLEAKLHLTVTKTIGFHHSAKKQNPPVLPGFPEQTHLLLERQDK